MYIHIVVYKKYKLRLHSPKILFSTFHVGKGSRAQPYPAVTIMNNFIASTYQNLAPAEHFYGDTCSILGDSCSRIILKQLFIIYFKLRLVKYFYSAITMYFDKYIYYDNTHNSVGGSVVECSPATRATRVRFPADANLYPKTFGYICKQIKVFCSLTINLIELIQVNRTGKETVLHLGGCDTLS
ncbi:hypothetical protein T01_3842 [Trichinella spiralis]|uniref:Uncharacterized protein n=1 Tax=Trichinella spiralis TaxID=6334 RepID=A0A0V1BU27_TRISP|nr:hypothetical protein T01_3842 [Trichinella spiralis]